MLEGLYKIKYRTPDREGSGICVIKDGQVVGGGDVLFFTGHFKERGRWLVGDLQAKRYAPVSEASSIQGLDAFHIHLEGSVSDGLISLSAQIAEAPSLRVQAQLTHLRDV